jgi:hypothetical protein
MDRKTRLPVDTSAIKAIMKEQKYTYKDIEEASGGIITETKLKDMLNKVGKTDESIIDSLAVLLNCEKNDLIDKEYLLSMNLSFDVNKIVGNLYLRNREDINCFYARKIKEFRTQVDLKTILNQAHRLFLTLLSDDFIFDKTAFVKAFNLIRTDFIKDNCIGNMQITEIQDTVVNNLYSKITNALGDYNVQQVMLMFLYVFILFDAIFLEEAVASVTQLVPERKTKKADQYFELAYKSERMRDTLIALILCKDGQLDYPNIIEYCIDDEVVNGISLMLAACEKCYQHIHGNYADSEYINRVEFSAILSQLESVFKTLGIELPENNFLIDCININTTRFGRYYNMLKSVFVALNPPRKPKDKFLSGYIMGKLS